MEEREKWNEMGNRMEEIVKSHRMGEWHQNKMNGTYIVFTLNQHQFSCKISFFDNTIQVYYKYQGRIQDFKKVSQNF